MRKNLGPLFVLCSAVLMSFGGLMIKAIPWGAMAVNGGRNLVAAGFTLAGIYLSGGRLKTNRAVLGCAACIATCCVTYTLAVRLTTAANAIVLQYTSPVFIILYLALFFKQKPRRADLLACAVVFAGMVCFFLESLSAGGMGGNVLALVAAATYAIVFMVNLFPGADSMSSYFWAQVMGAAVGLPWLLTEPNQSAGSWLAILLMGAVQISLAYQLMSRGLKTTRPVAANLICMTEPILNPLWVAVFYGETMGPLAVLGMVVVMAGLTVYNLHTARQG